MDRTELLNRRSEEYSFQDFTNQYLRTATDLNGAVIIGSCFYQVCSVDFVGDPLKHIFPGKMWDVLFVECNLDNVYIPPGNTMYKCSHRRIRQMNDGEYWFVGENLKPIEPIHKKRLRSLGANVDPSKITSERISAVDLQTKHIKQMIMEQDIKQMIMEQDIKQMIMEQDIKHGA